MIEAPRYLWRKGKRLGRRVFRVSTFWKGEEYGLEHILDRVGFLDNEDEAREVLKSHVSAAIVKAGGPGVFERVDGPDFDDDAAAT